MSGHAPTQNAQRLTPVDAVATRVAEISTLPHVALRVLEVARDAEATAADLRSVVESDPSLSARVLRCVNSAACGLRRKLSNIQEAISYLGFCQIRNLALTASVSELFRKGDTIGTYHRPLLWRHMVSVAVCARLLVSRLASDEYDDAFLAGLLHDIGIILEDQQVHDRFEAVILSLQDGCSLCEREREQLGFDHTVLGARVAEHWKFPQVLRDTIRFHHASQQYRGDHPAVVQSVEIANVICTVKGISSVGRNTVQPPIAAMEALGLDKTDIKVVAEDLDDELLRYGNLLEM